MNCKVCHRCVCEKGAHRENARIWQSLIRTLFCLNLCRRGGRKWALLGPLWGSSGAPSLPLRSLLQRVCNTDLTQQAWVSCFRVHTHYPRRLRAAPGLRMLATSQEVSAGSPEVRGAKRPRLQRRTARNSAPGSATMLRSSAAATSMEVLSAFVSQGMGYCGLRPGGSYLYLV